VCVMFVPGECFVLVWLHLRRIAARRQSGTTIH